MHLESELPVKGPVKDYSKTRHEQILLDEEPGMSSRAC